MFKHDYVLMKCIHTSCQENPKFQLQPRLRMRGELPLRPPPQSQREAQANKRGNLASNFTINTLNVRPVRNSTSSQFSVRQVLVLTAVLTAFQPGIKYRRCDSFNTAVTGLARLL